MSENETGMTTHDDAPITDPQTRAEAVVRQRNDADAVALSLCVEVHAIAPGFADVSARSCDIEFLAPATPGTTLRAVATRRRGLVRGSIYDVAITGSDGGRVAALRSDDRPCGRGRRAAPVSD